MRSPNDLWEALGNVEIEEVQNVLTKLFVIYEEILQLDPESEPAKLFFRNLDLALTLTDECNLNRR